MSSERDQKVAIVTGASSSIRRVPAVALAKERVKVTVTARRQIRLKFYQ